MKKLYALLAKTAESWHTKAYQYAQIAHKVRKGLCPLYQVGVKVLRGGIKVRDAPKRSGDSVKRGDLVHLARATFASRYRRMYLVS